MYRSNVARILLVITTSVVGLQSANAALPTGVTDAMTDMTTNVGLLGVILVAAAALAISFKWLKGMLFG